MPARLSAFVIWALVAAGLVFWAYRLLASPLVLPANVQTVAESPAAAGDLTRLLGAAPAPQSLAPAPVAETSRFRLLGVLAPVAASGAAGQSKGGVALIAIDGKPARAYTVGSQLDSATVLQSISRRTASLGPEKGVTSVVLELSKPPAPTTGALPKVAADGEPAGAVAPSPSAVPAPSQAPAMPVPSPPQSVPQALPGDAPSQGDEPAPPRRRRGVGAPASL
jgi:general secretion pathway protein C